MVAIRRAVRLSELRTRLDLVGYPRPSPLFRRVLERASEMVGAWQGRLYFVYLPEAARYASRRGKGDPKHHAYAEVLALAKDLALPVIDFQATLVREPDPLVAFSGYGHYNARGYAMLAQAIAARLRQDGAVATH